MSGVAKNSINRLMCYLVLNSKEMRNILTRDAFNQKKQGLTKTFYEGDSTREIVYRLMDNRNFKEAGPELRKKLIYTNYYPEAAKVLESVYLDDRRSLCQEFHNRLAQHYKVPPTTVSFSDFNGLDAKDLFYVYDPLSGEIYLNSNFTEEDDRLQLLIYIAQATAIHALQIKTNNLCKNYDNYTEKEKYLCLSMLLAESALAYLTMAGRHDDRKGLAASNDYSAVDIFAFMQAYSVLEQVFKEYGLTNVPEVDDYLSEKEDFMLALNGELEENMEEDPLDELEDDEEEYEKDALLNTTLCRDFTMLQEIKTSIINQQTKGDVFNIFLKELNENANEFYESFNFPLDSSYKNQYRDFMELEEAEENEDYEDIPYYSQSEDSSEQ